MIRHTLEHLSVQGLSGVNIAGLVQPLTVLEKVTWGRLLHCNIPYYLGSCSINERGEMGGCRSWMKPVCPPPEVRSEPTKSGGRHALEMMHWRRMAMLHQHNKRPEIKRKKWHFCCACDEPFGRIFSTSSAKGEVNVLSQTRDVIAGTKAELQRRL